MDLPPRMSIVASRFSPQIVDEMVAAAIDEAASLGATVVRTVRVAGAYEIPLALQTVLEKKDSDAIVVLGYIEKGHTLHGEVMGHVVHSEIVRLSLEHRVPLGIGTIGPGATLDQAESRWESYARAGVQAALSTISDIAI